MCGSGLRGVSVAADEAARLTSCHVHPVNIFGQIHHGHFWVHRMNPFPNSILKGDSDADIGIGSC